MGEKWSGITVASDSVTIVSLLFENDPPVVIEEDTYPLQRGEREPAYNIMYRFISNHLREKGVHYVAIRATTPPQVPSRRSAHWEAAELRGVVIAAAFESGAQVRVIKKETVSKNFGKRKADEYVKDDSYWANQFDRPLKKGSREAALLILYARKR